MKYIFQITILVLMLSASGTGYAKHSVALIAGRIESDVIKDCSDGHPTVTAQLIDNIEPEDRTKIRLSALVALGPEIGVSIFEAVAATRLLRQSKYADRAYIGKSADEIRLALAKKDLQGFNEA